MKTTLTLGVRMLVAFALCFFAETSHAQTGTVPLAQILNLPADAESQGRGNTNLATPSSFGNVQAQPATMLWGMTTNGEIQSAYAITNRNFAGKHLSSLTYSNVSQDNDNVSAFFLNVRTLTGGVLQNDLARGGDYRGFAATVGHVRELGEHHVWSTGYNATLIGSALTQKAKGEAISVAFSFAYDGRNDYGQGFTVGFIAKDFGTPFCFTGSSDPTDSKTKLLPVPADIGIGFAYNVANTSDTKSGKFLISAEIHKTILLYSTDESRIILANQVNTYGPFNPQGSYTINLGSEYKLPLGNGYGLAMRAGGIIDSNNMYYSGATFGLGLTVANHLQISTSYFAMPDMKNTVYGNSYTLTISYALSGLH
jgi:hypothetical protein